MRKEVRAHTVIGSVSSGLKSRPGNCSFTPVAKQRVKQRIRLRALTPYLLPLISCLSPDTSPSWRITTPFVGGEETISSGYGALCSGSPNGAGYVRPALIISLQRQRFWAVWERLQPRMNSAFFAAEATPTGYFLVLFAGMARSYAKTSAPRQPQRQRRHIGDDQHRRQQNEKEGPGGAV